MIGVPLLYYKMDELGMLDCNNENYLWIFDMKWIPIEKLSFRYDIISEGVPLITFARGMGGDYWCFKKETGLSGITVCLCEHTEFYGVYFADSLPNAIFKEIIFYCGSACFDDEPTVAANELILKNQITLYTDRLKGVLDEKQINILKELTKKILNYKQADMENGWRYYPKKKLIRL